MGGLTGSSCIARHAVVRHESGLEAAESPVGSWRSTSAGPAHPFGSSSASGTTALTRPMAQRLPRVVLRPRKPGSPRGLCGCHQHAGQITRPKPPSTLRTRGAALARRRSPARQAEVTRGRCKHSGRHRSRRPATRAITTFGMIGSNRCRSSTLRRCRAGAIGDSRHRRARSGPPPVCRRRSTPSAAAQHR